MLSFSIRNFGCRVNQAEAFAWTEIFRAGGLKLADDWETSDLVLINSCTLTSRADRDVQKFIRKVSEENPKAKLVVTGCYADVARQALEKTPGVLLVLPNNEKRNLPEKVLSLLAGPPPGENAGTGTAGTPGAFFRSRALLKVQDGCNNRCTFCVIPRVRGKSASVGTQAVLCRVRNLVGQGYREIVMAGIHLSSYGEDLEPRGSLLGLLREIGMIDGLGGVRLSSLDPRRTDGALLAHVAGHPKICQHFHLSLQHASEMVLEEMGRAGGPHACRSQLSELRARSPEAALGADVIVGFPGETEKEFAILEDFLRRSALTYFHVFAYSPRPGTLAAARPQVPGQLKKLRSLALRRLSAEKDYRFRLSLAGKELGAIVLAGKPGRKGGEGGQAEVLTGNAVKVSVPSCPAPAREAVRVRIDRVLPRSTEGSLVP
jgi:threonylcarbamoyladenosine tRNA methylthiotransferase MtaB